jgi:hypothetical protein
MLWKEPKRFPSIPKTGLEAHYPLTTEYVSGTTAEDSSGNNKDGTTNGGPTTEDSGTTFDGTDDIIDIPYFSGMENQFSIAAKVTWGSGHDGKEQAVGLFDGNDAFLGKDNDYSGDTPIGFIWDGSPNYAEAANSISTGTTRTYATTWDGSTLSMYEDGNFSDSTSVSNMYSRSDGNTIGGTADPSRDRYFTGELAYVALYDRALSSSEVSTYHDEVM